MEVCEIVGEEIDNILYKFVDISERFPRDINEAVEFFISFQNHLQQAPSNPEFTEDEVTTTHLRVAKVNQTCLLANQHRSIHSSISKFGKAIDKNFQQDYIGYASSNLEQLSGVENEKLLSKAICEHVYRYGCLEIGDELARESGLDMDDKNKHFFVSLKEIQDKLKEKNLVSALQWAQTYRSQLTKQNSNLEYKLLRLQFLQLLAHGPEWQSEALTFAKTHFPIFAHQHGADIQRLMGIFLYIPSGVHTSPYRRFFDPSLWAEIRELFTKDACALFGFSAESPLEISVDAGSIALPALLNMKKKMDATGAAWNPTSELPISIDTGRFYHSVFVCPMLKQQVSETNPPMRLRCGHVISRLALEAFKSRLVGCPYCSQLSDVKEVAVLYF